MNLKRRNIAIVLAGVLVAALIFATTRQANDPVYEGKHLSEWLVLLSSRTKPWTNERDQRDAEGDAPGAIVAIGTNALPYLTEAITFGESTPSRTAIRWLMLKVPPLEEIGMLRTWAYSTDEAKRAYGAMRAFQILGPRAAPAIPALAKLASVRTNFTAHAAVGALEAIGPAAQPALIDFIAKHLRSPARSVAIRSLDIGETTVNNLPMLLECLGDSDISTVRAAANVLGRIKGNHELVVPALIERLGQIRPGQPATKLTDDQLLLRREIVLALGELGSKAHAAIPILLEILNETNVEETEAFRLIKTLGLVANKSEPVVTVLITYLNHTNNWLQHCSVVALAKLGPLASGALPALTNALHHRSGDQWIEYAIQQITSPSPTNALPPESSQPARPTP